MQGRRFAFPAFLAVILLAMSSIANAGPYSNVFVYGDSLSDTGNIYNASGHTIPQSPPYYMGRFSNGPLAVNIGQLARRTADEFCVGRARRWGR